MRALFSFLLCALGICVQAQFIPAGISYQAVAREPGGNEIIQQNLTVRMGIIGQSPDGALLYEEVHDVVTNEFGLFALTLGGGIPTGNAVYLNLAEVPFRQYTHFLRVEIDTPGPDGFEIMGVSELLAVPYAYHALSADSAPELDGDISNELITSLDINGSQLIVTEGGVNHTVDFSGLIGPGGGNIAGLQIDSAYVDGHVLKIVEAENITSVDLTPVVETNWQSADGSVFNTSDLIGIGTAEPSSTLTVGGSLALKVGSWSPDGGNQIQEYSPGEDDYAIICNVSGGAGRISLPISSSCPGRMYQVRKLVIGSAPYPLKIRAQTGDTIDLQQELEFSSVSQEYITLISNGSGWFVLNHSSN